MVDISDSKFKQVINKPWTAWNLPGCSTEIDSVKLREANKPKEPDKPRDQCNLLPHSLMQLYGTKPEIECFSVTTCPACKCVMKSQWMSKHFKRDTCNNLVCRRTEMVVNGNRCLGKATTPLYDIRESVKDPLSEFSIHGSSKITTRIPSGPALDNVTLPQLSPRQKHTSHKTETFTSSSSSSHINKSKSNSTSHSKKHSSSNSLSSSSNSLNKHKSSSKTVSPSSSNIWSSSSSKKDSSKSHKLHNTASYVLSIPSDDTSHNESVESILLSNSSKQTMHIITGKSKSLEPEYEQLKFYADSSDKRSKAAADADHKSHKLHFSPQLENFKIPLKNKPSSSGSNSESSKKSKSSSSHSSYSSKSTNDSSKFSFRHSSSSSSTNKPIPSLTIISEAPKMNHSITSTHSISEVKEKSSSHSKKKKKKKSRDEPRKIIPLKERAFNPELHCGVVVSEDSLPCTRSLTCKTHSIALRRAVHGRSHPFDSLLAAHKKARDEEKAKSKEVVDESKSKGKKSSNPAPVPADSDSSSSSLPQPVSVAKTNTNASSGKSGSSITFNTTSLSESTPSNGKHSVHSSSKPVSSHSLPLRHQVSKPAAVAKATNRPVIIVDEKKEGHGISLLDLGREPENNFVYISSIEAPKSFVNVKELEGKTSRNNALSEWNPLDRFSRKGSGGVKKKGFKDPLVSLLPFKVASTTSDIDTHLEIYAQRKDVTSGGDIYVDTSSGRTSATSALGRSETLKRKASSGSSPSPDTCTGTFKKSRVFTSPQKFYDALRFKNSKKPESATKLKRLELTACPGILQAIVGNLEEHSDSKTQIFLDDYSSRDSDSRITAKNFYDALSVDAREFLTKYAKTHSDNKESLDKSLSDEEMCQHAFELINKFILS